MYFTLLGIGDFLDWEAFSSVLSGMRGVGRAIFKLLESLHWGIPIVLGAPYVLFSFGLRPFVTFILMRAVACHVSLGFC